MNRVSTCLSPFYIPLFLLYCSDNLPVLLSAAPPVIFVKNVCYWADNRDPKCVTEEIDRGKWMIHLQAASGVCVCVCVLNYYPPPPFFLTLPRFSFHIVIILRGREVLCLVCSAVSEFWGSLRGKTPKMCFGSDYIWFITASSGLQSKVHTAKDESLPLPRIKGMRGIEFFFFFCLFLFLHEPRRRLRHHVTISYHCFPPKYGVYCCF